MTKQLGYELLWGDAFPRCVQSIVVRAVARGTVEELEKAVAKLDGICSFIGHMSLGEFATDAVLIISAEQLRLQRLIDDPQLREQVMQDMQQYLVARVKL